MTGMLIIAGRILIGGLFVFGGVIHFFRLDALTEVMAARGVPFPRIALIAGSVFQAIAGAALMAGVFVIPAAFGLIAFTAAASVIFLNFWDLEEGIARETAFNVFMTNVALMGGLLLCAATA
jgi:putative oxidoreductase